VLLRLHKKVFASSSFLAVVLVIEVKCVVVLVNILLCNAKAALIVLGT